MLAIRHINKVLTYLLTYLLFVLKSTSRDVRSLSQQLRLFGKIEDKTAVGSEAG